MRAAVAATLIIAGVAAFASPEALADSTSTAAGAGASVSVVTGNNGGTTIIVDSDRPCRTVAADSTPSHDSGPSPQHSGSSSNTTTIGSGSGGLSGTTTIGPNGPSVSMSAGGGTVTTSPSGGGTTARAGAGECIVVIRGGGSPR